MNNDYLTVSEVNRYIKNLFDLDRNLNRIFIKGEISNFKAHTKGHFYFSLKDDQSKINALMFLSNTKNIKFTPCDGMKVFITGRVSVYEATGGYQIYVEEMIEDGIGNLYIEYEKLKKKLEEEGLFAKEHKRKIKKMPKRIGIITASTGAAIKDILTTIKRRYPICETILFPSLVQGNEAAKDIVKNIRLANNYALDTLIVGRGGGSIEDLWPFNEEIVARAIYESKIPIISAVGHEVDFTIADFVADLRAPTPTAAAELAVPDMNNILTYLTTAKNRMYSGINNIIECQRMSLNKLRDSYILKRPLSIYEIKMQHLDNLINRCNNSVLNKIENKKIKLFELSNNYILTNPTLIYKYQEQKLMALIGKVKVLNPLETLNRGYAIVKDKKKIISSVNKVEIGQKIVIELKDGSFNSIVESVVK